MSTPVRGPENRKSRQVPAVCSAMGSRTTPADVPPRADLRRRRRWRPGSADRTRERRPLPPRFEGDVAMEALRAGLPSIRSPCPSRRSGCGGQPPALGRPAVRHVRARGARGLRAHLGSARRAAGRDRRRARSSSLARPVATKSARGAPSRARASWSRASAATSTSRWRSVSRSTARSSGETLLVAGFAEGTRLSAGAPLGRTGWHLSAIDARQRDGLRAAGLRRCHGGPGRPAGRSDRLVDSQERRLEWLPKQSEAQARSAGRAAVRCNRSPDEIAGLLKRGAGIAAHRRHRLGTAAVAACRQCRQRGGGAGAGRNLRRRGSPDLAWSDSPATRTRRASGTGRLPNWGRRRRAASGNAGKCREVGRTQGRPPSAARWCRASGHTATAGTSVRPAATPPVPRRARRSRTDGSGRAAPGSSSRRPRGRIDQSLHRHRPNRWADGGSGSRPAPRRYSDSRGSSPGQRVPARGRCRARLACGRWRPHGFHRGSELAAPA